MAVSYEAWYPHDASASHHPKLVALRSEFGWEAEAWFWHLLGLMRLSETRSIHWGRLYVRSGLASFFCTTVERLSTTVERMCNDLELFELVDGELHCPAQREVFENLDRVREQRSMAGKASAQKRMKSSIQSNGRSTGVDLSLTSRQQSRVRVEKRREEKKGNNNIGVKRKFISPTLLECQAYAPGIGMSSSDAEAFFDYWTSAGWKRKQGPMADWQASMRTWHRNNFSNTNNGRSNGKTQAQQRSDFNAKDLDATGEAFERDVGAILERIRGTGDQ